MLRRGRDGGDGGGGVGGGGEYGVMMGIEREDTSVKTRLVNCCIVYVI